MKSNLILVSIFLLTIFSCDNSDNSSISENIYIVASKQLDCEGVGKQKCFLVKKNQEDNWQFFYSSIIGFEYQEGFEYELLVSEKEIENPPQDSSSVEYTLVKVKSKVEKDSENLPN